MVTLIPTGGNDVKKEKLRDQLKELSVEIENLHDRVAEQVSDLQDILDEIIGGLDDDEDD